MNYEDHKALELLTDKAKRVKDSTHFEAPLLWREGEIKLPSAESKKVALKRLEINEHVMVKENSYEVIIDLAGPIQVSVNQRTTANRYIFVYSCLTTRAIHLELIESLDTNATLMALQIEGPI